MRVFYDWRQISLPCRFADFTTKPPCSILSFTGWVSPTESFAESEASEELLSE